MKHSKEISENIDEYLEEMYRCEISKKEISTKGLAGHLRISMPSVSQMLAKLKDNGMIRYEPRRMIALTDSGRKIGAQVYRRHETMLRFVMGLGMSGKKAEDEACRLEHAVSDELEALIRKKLDG